MILSLLCYKYRSKYIYYYADGNKRNEWELNHWICLQCDLEIGDMNLFVVPCEYVAYWRWAWRVWTILVTYCMITVSAVWAVWIYDISFHGLFRQPICMLNISSGATTFSKLGFQFLGLGYYTEQNMDGIPSFVHCSVLCNGSHTLHQKSWGGPSKFWGVRIPPTPQWLRPWIFLHQLSACCCASHWWYFL